MPISARMSGSRSPYPYRASPKVTAIIAVPGTSTLITAVGRTRASAIGILLAHV
jgi:hypothetical protein